MFNICLLVNNITNSFSKKTNALVYFSFLLYLLLEKIPNTNVYIMSSDFNFSDKISFLGKQFNFCNFNLNDMKNNKINVIIEIFCCLKNETRKQIKEHIPQLKYGLFQLGNPHYIDSSNFLYMGDTYNGTPSLYKKYYDFIWLLPQYERHITYLKTMYKTDNVHIAPTLWEPYLIEFENNNEVVKVNMDTINIGIFEGNILPTKTSIIPLYICEAYKLKNQNQKYNINKVHLTNLQTFGKKQKFQNNLHELSIFENIIQINNPVELVKYIKNHKINVIISHQIHNSLNALYFECLYFNIPLIHNSPEMKEYGYYYPEFDIEIGRQQLQDVIEDHDKQRDLYNYNNKEILKKFSIHNPENIYKYIKLLNNI